MGPLDKNGVPKVVLLIDEEIVKRPGPRAFTERELKIVLQSVWRDEQLKAHRGTAH